MDKIVGPGNRYVAAAKALVAGRCAIDFYAGPTEIVIVAGAGRPDWIAADLIAQAEHDPDARAVLITWSRSLATRVTAAVARQSAGRAIVERALRANGAIVLVGTPAAAIALANRFAPEHLVLDRESLAARPITAGAVFIGPYTAQAAGDYATGSNHVLPTAGAARFRGGLSAADFVRVMSVQRVTRAGPRPALRRSFSRWHAPRDSRRTPSRWKYDRASGPQVEPGLGPQTSGHQPPS